MKSLFFSVITASTAIIPITSQVAFAGGFEGQFFARQNQAETVARNGQAKSIVNAVKAAMERQANAHTVGELDGPNYNGVDGNLYYGAISNGEICQAWYGNDQRGLFKVAWVKCL